MPSLTPFARATVVNLFFFASLNAFVLLPLYIEHLGARPGLAPRRCRGPPPAAHLPTFAESLGVETLALFYTAYAGAAMAVRIFGGRLIDTRGRRAGIVPSMFVQAVATALLAALVADRASELRRGAVIGVFSAVFLVGQTAGAFVFVAHGAGYAWTWTILTSLLVLGSLLSVGLAADAPRPARR